MNVANDNVSDKRTPVAEQMTYDQMFAAMIDATSRLLTIVEAMRVEIDELKEQVNAKS